MIGVSVNMWQAIYAAGGQPPALSNSNGTITATGGYPAPPILTNDNGTITAEAA